MKKHMKVKKSLSPAQIVQEFADQILKVQQQLTFLDKKIDTLISQPPRPVQRFEGPRHEALRRPENNFRERVLHRVICADCKKECEVPFKPTGDRPVYCRDCFAKRKHGSAFMKDRPSAAPRHSMPKEGMPKESAPREKKKPAFRKKKSHSKN